MPTAYFGNLTKSINSTKQFSGGTARNVKFLNPTSRNNPVITLKSVGFPTWNYMRMNFDGKTWYYYIKDIISLNYNRYEVHASLDPLATFKSNILNTTGFINYGPTTFNDTELNDPRFTSDVVHEVQYDEQEFDIMDISGGAIGSGCVVMRILSLNSYSGIKTICGDLSSWETFVRDYAADVTTQLTSLTGWERLLGEAMGYTGPLDAIKSAIWLPISLDQIKGSGYQGDFSGHSVVGTWYNVKGNVIKGAIQSSYANLALTLNSNLIAYPWLKSARYLSLVLNTPGGTLDLSNNNKIFDMGNQINLRCRLLVSIDGDCTLYVYAPITAGSTAYEIVGIQKWNCASDLKQYIYKAPSPMLEGFKEGIKIGSAIMQVGGGVMMEGGGTLASKSGAESFGAKVGSEMYNIGNTATSNPNMMNAITSGITGSIPTTDMTGNVSNFSGTGNITCLYANENLKTLRFYAIQRKPEIFNGENNTLDPAKYTAYCNKYGYPIFNYGGMYKNGNLIEGYYQFAGAYCNAPAPPEALSTINSFLNSGIIIE